MAANNPTPNDMGEVERLAHRMVELLDYPGVRVGFFVVVLRRAATLIEERDRGSYGGPRRPHAGAPPPPPAPSSPGPAG